MPEIKRACGSCTACCKTHGVHEIEKRAGDWCVSCRVGKGCAVYESRPASCEKFECQWLQGSWDEEFRPDKLRVVIDYVHYESIGGTMVLFEVSHGALIKNSVLRLEKLLLAQGFSVLRVPLADPAVLKTVNAVSSDTVFMLEGGRVVQVVMA